MSIVYPRTVVLFVYYTVELAHCFIQHTLYATKGIKEEKFVSNSKNGKNIQIGNGLVLEEDLLGHTKLRCQICSL